MTCRGHKTERDLFTPTHVDIYSVVQPGCGCNTSTEHGMFNLNPGLHQIPGNFRERGLQHVLGTHWLRMHPTNMQTGRVPIMPHETG
jgi:hypothetical protein